LGPTFLPLIEMQLQVHVNKAGCNFPPNNSSCCCCCIVAEFTSLQLAADTADIVGIVASTMENFAGVVTGVEHSAN
jgi:hypothetical protein